MCTTIGFSYSEGIVFGRTLEMGVALDNHILYIPANYAAFIRSRESTLTAKYALIGTGFMDQVTLGDGINEMGLMGSNNLLPGYATFSNGPVEEKINLTTAQAFNYLLSNCKDTEEVRQKAKDLIVNEHVEKDISNPMHFFFMDTNGKGLVLEPKDGILLEYDNPYGVLTNSPEFPWHITNLKNYLNLQPENIEEKQFNRNSVTKFGEGSGLVGLPGDFTPPSRFVRAAYFVSNTPKDLARSAAILQGFRILSQSDIPTGAVIDPKAGNNDETLYTAIMDTETKSYHIKCHDNINIQSFNLKSYRDETDIKVINLKKEMNF